MTQNVIVDKSLHLDNRQTTVRVKIVEEETGEIARGLLDALKMSRGIMRWQQWTPNHEEFKEFVEKMGYDDDTDAMIDIRAAVADQEGELMLYCIFASMIEVGRIEDGKFVIKPDLGLGDAADLEPKFFTSRANLPGLPPIRIRKGNLYEQRIAATLKLVSLNPKLQEKVVNLARLIQEEEGGNQPDEDGFPPMVVDGGSFKPDGPTGQGDGANGS